MTELKLRRLLEHNQRLREDLARPRIRVSEASARFVCSPHSRPPISQFPRLQKPFANFVLSSTSLIRYCKTTTDHLVSPLGCLAAVVHHVGDVNLPTTQLLNVLTRAGRSFSAHPGAPTGVPDPLTVWLTIVHPCADSFRLGACQQGRRSICASGTGVQLRLDVTCRC